MAQVTIDTVAYPSWWTTVETVLVEISGASYNVPRAAVELLPQGVAFPYPGGSGQSVLLPWHQILKIDTA